MRYTIEYNGTYEEKHAKAIADVQEYLGEKYEPLMQLIVDAVCDKCMPFCSLEYQLALFVGIEGFPAKAMWNEALNIIENSWED